MRIDLNKVEYGVRRPNGVSREEIESIVEELWAARAVVDAVRDREAAGYEVGVVATETLNKYEEVVKCIK